MVLAVSVLASCGGKQQLKTAKQADEFIRDIATGGSVDDWARDGDATLAADNAWENRRTIDELGAKLEDGADWACKVADAFTDAAKIDEAVALNEAMRGERVARAEVNSLASMTRALGNSEATQAVDAVCQTAQGP